ncbi:MAG: SulP family inorganic anion transporter [Flavobacteriales bacterium]
MKLENKSLFGNLGSDLPAGLVVYLVALPLCLGIALASTGQPDLLFSGVIAGVVGGIIVGSWSGSPLGVSGPAAGLVVIVLAALKDLGSFEVLLMAIVLAGIIQLIGGFLRVGIIGHYFPSSVIKGMLAAIGITLVLKEIPHALGYDEDFIGDFALEQKDGHNTFNELYYAFKFNSHGAILISIVSLAMLVLFELKFMKKFKLFKFLPGALFVVLTGILMNYLFIEHSPDMALAGKHLVQLPAANNAEEFIGFFRFPDFDALNNPHVYTVAATIAIVASLETLLCVEATDKLDPYKRVTPTNRELRAQGVGNIVSGLIGGLPITQVIVRSSANINAGGKTKLASITHGIILLLSAVFIPRFLNLVPLASLAAILFVVGFKLTKPSLYKSMYKLGWEQFAPFLVTIVAILFTDLLKGIAIGMAVALFFILRRNHMNSYHSRHKLQHGKVVIHLRLSEEVTFLNKGSILKTLNEIPENSNVVIDGTRSEKIDYDVLEVIQNFKDITAKNKNIDVETISIPMVEATIGH